MHMKKFFTFLFIGSLFLPLALSAQNSWSEVATVTDLPENVSDYELSGNYLIACGSFVDGFIDVYDVTNPVSPDLLKRMEYTDTDFSDMLLEGDKLYVVGEDGLFIFDFSDPGSFSQIHHIKEVPDDSYYYGVRSVDSWAMYKTGDVVFVESGWSGIMAMGISDPANPVFYDIEGHTGVTKDIEGIDHNTLAHIDGYNLYIVDHSNLSDLSDVSIDIAGDPENLVLSSDKQYAYVSSEAISDKYLTVVDLSSKTVLKEISVSDYSALGDIAIYENHLFVGTNDGFIDFDITTPTDPTILEEVESGYYGSSDGAIEAMENYVFSHAGNDIVVYSDGASSPSVVTHNVTNIGSNSATGNAEITSIGTSNPSEHGICWSTESLPTLADNYIDEGEVSNVGTFSSSMTDLEDCQTYYVRAFVTANGTRTYGNEVSFTTLDGTLPEITSTHNDQTVDPTENCEAVLPDYTGDVTATDNCDSDLTVLQSPSAGSTITGTTQVTLSVRDDAGNVDEISFNVVVADNENPVITSTHDNQFMEADDNCEAGLPDFTGDVTATDNCDSELDITQSPVAGTLVSLGINTVTLTVADGAGNTDDISFDVTVEDITKPTITCVGNQSIEIDESETGYTVSGVEFDPESFGDNCTIPAIINDFNNNSTLDNAEFPVGTTAVVWKVTDDAGNEAECSFDVTVEKAEATHIAALDKLGISLYPNPTTDNIYLEGNLNDVRLSVTDMAGNILFMGNLNGVAYHLIDLSQYPDGTYIVRIENEGIQESVKIIKK